MTIHPRLAIAEDPPLGYLTQPINFGESIGFYNYLPSNNIPENAAQNIRNVDYSVTGDLSVRRGASTYFEIGAPTGEAASNLLSVWVSSTGGRYFIAKVGNRIHTIATTNALNARNPNPITGQADIVSWSSAAYIVSENTRIIKVSELVTLSSVAYSYIEVTPGGKYAQSHLGRLVVAGSTVQSDAMFLFYSDEDSPESHRFGNYIQIPAIRDSDPLTGIGPSLLNILPIYTRNTTRTLIGTVFPSDSFIGNLSVRLISQTVGCVHHKTIKNFENGQYFYSIGENGTAPGIYKFNGTSVKEVTKSIRKYFQDTIDTTTSTIPCAYVSEDRYCLNVATIGGRDLTVTVCYGPTDKKIEIMQQPSMDQVVAENGTLYGVSGVHDNTNTEWNEIYRLDSGSVDGSTGAAYSWRYQTKDFDLGRVNRTNYKIPERAYIQFERNTGTFTVIANYDFGNSTTVWTIDTSTKVETSDVLTVMINSQTVINRLNFPGSIRFNYINFDLFGSSRTTIDRLDFYTIKESLP